MKLLNKQVPVDRLFQTLAPAELKEMIEASVHADLALQISDRSPVPEMRRKDVIRRVSDLDVHAEAARGCQRDRCPVCRPF